MICFTSLFPRYSPAKSLAWSCAENPGFLGLWGLRTIRFTLTCALNRWFGSRDFSRAFHVLQAYLHFSRAFCGLYQLVPWIGDLPYVTFPVFFIGRYVLTLRCDWLVSICRLGDWYELHIAITSILQQSQEYHSNSYSSCFRVSILTFFVVEIAPQKPAVIWSMLCTCVADSHPKLIKWDILQTAQRAETIEF